MKGKIRVYCRARPLSSTETDRVLISDLLSNVYISLTKVVYGIWLFLLFS